MRIARWSLYLLLSAAGCGADRVTAPAGGTLIEPAHLAGVDLTPGIRTVLVGPSSAPLRLTIAVPDPAPAGDAPLVLALHWAGPESPHLAEQYVQALAEPGLRDLGAIIIAPEATTTFWTGAAVELTLSSLVQSALAVWPVDPARVVVTGFSMGGVGTWYIVSLHPELFSAAIPMAGEPTAVLAPAVPLLAIHGDRDEIYPLEFTQLAVDSLQSMGGIAGLLVAPGLTHGQATAYIPYLAQAAIWLTGTIWAAP